MRNFPIGEGPNTESDVAAMMISAKESNKKFLFRRSREEGQRTFVKETLKAAPELFCLDGKEMGRAVAMTYGAR